MITSYSTASIVDPTTGARIHATTVMSAEEYAERPEPYVLVGPQPCDAYLALRPCDGHTGMAACTRCRKAGVR